MLHFGYFHNVFIFLFLNFLKVDQQTDFASPHSNQLEAELG